jgi:hypothetical protein
VLEMSNGNGNMEITLKPYAKSKNPINTYIIVCRAMHGDADKYEDFEFTFSKKESFLLILERLIEILKQSGHKNRDSMTELEHEFEKSENEDFWFEWPRDVTCDGQYGASLRAIKEMIYYDENGTKFKVAVDGKESM